MSIRPIIPAIAVLMAMAPAAHAGESRDGLPIVERVVISYQVGDLQTLSGAKKILERIGHAAGRACGEKAPFNLETLAIAYERDARACRAAAVARAVADLHAPLLTMVFSGKDQSALALGTDR
jgi:UrcA family protein